MARTLLTIDCDWGVTPTPLRDSALTMDTSEPDMTLEHVRYLFGARPDDDRHHMAMTPETLVAALRGHGLPRPTCSILTERHGHVREVWGDVLADADHIVCFDAHLDIYAVGSLSVTLPIPNGRVVRRAYRPTYREMAAGMPSLSELAPLAAGPAHETAWEQAWLLLLLERMPHLARLTWIVPEHFAPALGAGFPYPHAQWLRTLESGRDHGLWTFTLEPAARRINLAFREPELADRTLTISVVTLDGCPSLESVDAARLHICRSPSYLHPAADPWVDRLTRLLNE